MSQQYSPRPPLDNCPHCQVPVRWVLHDGTNAYDCSNRQCPIKFTERVWFPEDTEDFDFKAGHGVLFYYGFTVGALHAVIDYGGDGHSPQRTTSRLIFNPEYRYGDLRGGEIIIEEAPNLNWADLQALEEKLRTWVVFS